MVETKAASPSQPASQGRQPPVGGTAPAADGRPAPAATPSPATADKPLPAPPARKPEIGGPKGPEPTRYGDWEKGGRCIDF